MIHFEYLTQADHHQVTISGHAGSAPKGQDLVCAGASTLLYTLIQALEDRDIVDDLILEEGYANVKWHGYGLIGSVIYSGLKLLEKNYPDFVKEL